jgi:hypothetical protein
MPSRLCFLTTVLFIGVATVAPTAAETPRFNAHPATEKFKGTPAAPKLKGLTVPARWQLLVREMAKKGPNFAGAYTVVTYGCGTGCQVVLVIDARTGKIHAAPEPSTYGTTYRLNSRLLVFNADPLHKLRAKYYVFKDGKLRKLP